MNLFKNKLTMTPSLRIHVVIHVHVTIMWLAWEVGGLLFTPQSLPQMVCLLSLMLAYYRPCAADVRRLNFPDIYRIMTFFEWQKTVVSIAFSRNSALGIMSRQYVVQFQLGTTRLLRFIDFLLAVERTQQIMDSTTLYCIVSCHSKWRIHRVFPYISMLDDVTAQGLYYTAWVNVHTDYIYLFRSCPQITRKFSMLHRQIKSSFYSIIT